LGGRSGCSAIAEERNHEAIRPLQCLKAITPSVYLGIVGGHREGTRGSIGDLACSRHLSFRCQKLDEGMLSRVGVALERAFNVASERPNGFS
jgi:hypothetical protein